MTTKERMSLKLAIDTMERNINRYFNKAMYNRETKESVSFGEAINVLNDMLKAGGKNE